MFFATTALSEFWDRSEQLLFLGPWCLRIDRRSDWEGLSYKMLPNPWDDRKRYYQAAQYLDDYGERLLEQLAGYLNAVHTVSGSKRYWRIIIGPWLFHHLHIMFDRYVHLDEAFRLHPDLQTCVLDPRSFRVPRDQGEMMAWAEEDPYNLQLFSLVLGEMGYTFPAKPSSRESFSGQGERTEGSRPLAVRRLAALGRRLAEEVAIRLSGTHWQIALSQMYSGRRTMWALAWHSRFRALPVELPDSWSFPFPSPVFDAARTNLGTLPASNPFERAFVRSLPQSFPTLYLEGYRQARDEVSGAHRRIPPVLASAIGWYFHEPYKFWAAHAMERGSRLVTVQHGGGYGVFRFSAPELHEKRIGDTFTAWGWTDKEGSNCRNLPCPKHAELPNGGTRLPSLQRSPIILFVTTACVRYLYRFQSAPAGSQWVVYFEWQRRFLASLPEAARQRVLVRLHPGGHSVEIRERIAANFATIGWDESRPFYQSLRKAGLVILDHCGTGLLEALAADIPTILFWNPGHWELRAPAEPYFEGLCKAGILWDSPESAAIQVAKIGADPRAWWSRNAVQEARKHFVERFVYPRRDWPRYWDEALRREHDASQICEADSLV